MSHDSVDEMDEWSFDSRAIRYGQLRSAEYEHNDPIFLTSSFVFDNARQAAARFANEEPGNVYSRFTNPTVRTFEKRIASLEGAQYGIATGSGMAAIMTTCLALLRAGDHIVAANQLFGTTVSLFSNILDRLGIKTSFVSVTDLDAWRDAVGEHTRLLFVESPTNPLGEVADIAALAELAHAHGARLVVDNAVCTPALQLPLSLGADLVVHSATKYLDGQGRCVGGAIVVTEEKVYQELFAFLRTAGPSMSPFNAWVFLNGLETLSLRMRAHSDHAMVVARWLDEHPGVDRVYYTGLESHPQHGLAAAQQSGFGGIVSFNVKGGKAQAWQVLDSVRMLSITANLGDVKSTIVHPATTTHGRITQAQREAAGIGDNMVRVSVGLEDTGDIIADLARGLDGLAH